VPCAEHTPPGVFLNKNSRDERENFRVVSGLHHHPRYCFASLRCGTRYRGRLIEMRPLAASSAASFR
jgi:hypothetical protein